MLSRLIAVTLLCLMPAAGSAQTWPSITLVHGFGAGDNADSVARLMGASLSETLGTTVVIDAKPGAGGNITSEFVTRASGRLHARSSNRRACRVVRHQQDTTLRFHRRFFLRLADRHVFLGDSDPGGQPPSPTSGPSSRKPERIGAD